MPTLRQVEGARAAVVTASMRRFLEWINTTTTAERQFHLDHMTPKQMACIRACRRFHSLGKK